MSKTLSVRDRVVSRSPAPATRAASAVAGGAIGRIRKGRSSLDIGFRRVSWIRIVLAPDGPRYYAIGTGHRRLLIRAIPPVVARALIDSGIPVVLRRG